MQFEIKINNIRTANVGEFTNVVKQVDWTLTGIKEGQEFSLPQTTELADPNGHPFIPLSQLTEADVISWIESNEQRMPDIKAHIEQVLDKEVAKNLLISTPLPWVPSTTD